MIRKTCPSCKRNLPLNNFGLCKRDGFQSYCKKCKKEYGATRHKNKRDSRRTSIITYLKSRFYNIKKRCCDPSHHNYKHYGGRGIKCLFESSDEFVNYVLNELQINPRDLDFDRIDNNGHYEPGNIRLVSHKINIRNR